MTPQFLVEYVTYYDVTKEYTIRTLTIKFLALQVKLQ